jgi:Xaa-Pro aminopeptidase
MLLFFVLFFVDCIFQGASTTRRSSTIASFGLVPGMTLTDEPGYYEDGSFGIRIESVLVTQQVDPPLNAEFNASTSFVGFENITFIPIQRSLIDLSMLNSTEIDWINEYHQKCWDKVSPLLNGRTLEWLKTNCEKI